ncbi:MAG: glutamate--tRNA ligase [Thermoproteota archaeon]|nr:glutamate--tRNA ligase [Thermoproteota archaeon]
MEIDKSLYDFVKSIALKNASQHEGRTNANVVLSHLMSTKQDLKNSVVRILPLIKQVVQEVNSLSIEQQGHLIEQFSEYYKEKKLVQNDASLPELPDAQKGRVVTRFPPEPNGYPHIGHAKAAIIDEEYAKMYNGSMILRFDDTNPLNEKIEYYQAIRDGLEWLGIKPDLVKNTSDDIILLHNHGKRLVLEGHAYVCTCTSDIIHKNRTEQMECNCRKDQNSTNDRLDRMFNGYYSQNQAIIRFKGDMQSLNTTMRDPTLFRIIDHPHPLLGSKIRIWPTYDMAAPIEDSIDGVSHALRTKEYEMRNELYYSILSKLKMRAPIVMEFSRLEFDGMPVSKRKIKPLLESGIISSWDDPRLPTLIALRNRGFAPEAIRKFVLSLGITLAETKPPFETLESINRKMIDPISMKLFFVSSPVELRIEGGKLGRIELRNHPTQDLGKREVTITNEFYIPSSDVDDLQVGQEIRLMELYNIKISEIKFENNKKVLIGSFKDDHLIQSMKKIQWVAKNDIVEFSVKVPKELFIGDKYNADSLEVIKGYVESFASKLKAGTLVQFVRFGFCRLLGGNSATYTHR